MKFKCFCRSPFLLLILLFTSSHVYPDTVQLVNGKTIDNVTVKLGKEIVTLTYPDGRTESFHPDEIKSTDFSAVNKPHAVAAKKIPASPFRTTEKPAEQTGGKDKQPAVVKKDNSEPSLKEAAKYRFRKIAADIKSTWLKIRVSVGKKLEKTGKKLQDSKSPSPTGSEPAPKDDKNNK